MGRNLEAAALRVRYKLASMLEMAVRRCAATSNDLISNALLEVTPAHCRNLIEFLASTERYFDEIVPDDFVGGWDPALLRAPPGALKAIHKHLAHLTWTGVEEGKVLWQYPEIVQQVFQAMGRFVDHAEANGSPVASTLRGALPAGSGDPRRGVHPGRLTSTAPRRHRTTVSSSATSASRPLSLDCRRHRLPLRPVEGPRPLTERAVAASPAGSGRTGLCRPPAVWLGRGGRSPMPPPTPTWADGRMTRGGFRSSFWAGVALTARLGGPARRRLLLR